MLKEFENTVGPNTTAFVYEEEKEKELEELAEELERVAFKVAPLCEVYVVNPSDVVLPAV